MIYNNTKTLVESLMKSKIPTSKICLDMTFGNGNDSYKMLSINKSIQIYGFDIQKNCIDNAKKTNNLKVINDSHLNFENYTNEKIDFAVFNLGYLPGGDKNITTDYDTVIKTLEKLLKLMNIEGQIVITFYPGHRPGFEESINIINFLRNLNQKEFNVIRYDFINQINNPPFVCLIERIK